MHYNSKSESYTNIKRAFEDEAAGHVRYMILGENAEKEGKHDLARLYHRLSEEELSHARVWYGEQNESEALKNSISAEGEEATSTYPQYAARAEMEGYETLADRFIANGMAEGGHRELLMDYQRKAESGESHECNEDCVWRCTRCGYRHVGTTPPERCPLCDYRSSAYVKERD